MSSFTRQLLPHILHCPSYFAFIIVPMKNFRYYTIYKSIVRSEESLSDEWETPKELFDEFCEKYNIHPRLDPCATSANRKCLLYFTEEENGLQQEWEHDVWCNPPHSMTGDFVRKAYSEWLQNNINIMLLVPANTVSTIWWHEYVENTTEYHAIKGRIRFLRDGKPSEFVSRNSYILIIYRKNE